MGVSPCEACASTPVTRCGRCTRTQCGAHALSPGTRCPGCEHDWADEAPTRRAAKLIFVPPITVLVGGLLFGMMLPVSLGGMVGAVFMCALSCGSAIGAGAGACRLVDRSARSMFLREHAGALPTARLLSSPRHLG